MPTEFVKMVVLSLFRHALTAAAGVLVARGIISDGMQEQVIGYGVGSFAVIWAIGQKFGNEGAASALRWLADWIDAGKAAVVAVLLAALLLAPGDAEAKPKRQTRSVATVVSSLVSGDIWSQIQSASLGDLEYAAALATASGTPGGIARGKCWSEWANLIKAQSGSSAAMNGMKLEGSNVAFTRAEQLAQFADALQTDSPFMQACSPVAQRLKTQVFSFVGLVLKSGVTLAAFGL